MDYFRIREDRSYFYTPDITNLWDIVNRRAAMALKNESNISDINVGFARSEKQLDYVDVLDHQLFLVSEGIKRVLSIYDPSLIFKNLFLLNNLDGSYFNYYAPLFTEVDCLPEMYKIMTHRNKLEKLIIKAKAVEDYSVCKVAGIDTDIVIIRLDVAESLLRRGFTKLILERVVLED
uniref:hypothetical protein n=1 Tax=Clostridium sp. NkU-1 TaxID=1095009 RepID=UPI0006D0E029